VAEIFRKVGISQAKYYLSKRQYSGVGISELRELRQLREENGRLKRLSGPKHGPADPAGDRLKKAVRPRARRKLALLGCKEIEGSEQCRIGEFTEAQYGMLR
jgi:hypothetical protein